MQTFKQYLTEIGDSYKPYRYEKFKIFRNDDRPSGSTKFRTDSGEIMHVSFVTRKDGATSVSFLSERTNYEQTNRGLTEAFRVVATVIEAAAEWAKQIRPETIVFGSAEDPNKPGTEKQRAKLYLAFIKKKFPGAKITTGSIYTKIKIPDRFYK